jgi:hypothetical protein
MTKPLSITPWILNAFTDDLDQVAALTIRADGTITNGANARQSAWSKSPTGSLYLLTGALDRTVSQLGRGEHKDLKFVAFFGGDTSRGVFGHFHAFLQYPQKADRDEFIDHFKRLWSIKASNALKTTLNTSVFVERIQSKAAFADYCQRYEGTTFGGGSEKVVMSRSLKM